MIKKIALAGLGIALLATPLLASAQTVDVSSLVASLLAQIKTLQAQIAQLQGQSSGALSGTASSGTPSSGTSTSANSSASCVNLINNFSAGDTDATTNGEVTKLQQFLTTQYYDFGSDYVTGYFGPTTQTALQQWQRSHGIVSSGSPDTTGYGFIGPKTRAAIGCSIQQATIVPPPTGGSSPGMYATIDQRSLTASAGTITLTGTASGVSLVEVYLVRGDGYAYGDGTLGTDHGATITNNRWSFTATSLPAGTYTVTVKLSDMPSGSLPAGATLTTGTLTVTGSATRSLSLSCHGTPYNSGTPGVSWGSTPSGGTGSYTYQWTLSNDPTGSGDFSNTNQQNVLTTYGSIGVKSAAVTVSSGGQSVAANCSTTIPDTNTFPGLSLTAVPSTSSTYQFSFDPAQWGTYGYVLDFGDGSNITMCSINQGCRGASTTSHGYTASGTYTVTLYVVKADSAGTQTKSVVKTLSVTSNVNPSSNDSNSASITLPASGSSFAQDTYIPVTVTGSVSRQAYGTILVYQNVGGSWKLLPTSWPINAASTSFGPGQFTQNVPNVIFSSNTSLTWPTPPGQWGIAAQLYTYGCGGSDCNPPTNRILATSSIVPITITGSGTPTVTINTGAPNVLPITYQNLRPGTYARVIGVNLPWVYLPVTFSNVFPMTGSVYTNNGIASVTLSGSGQTSITLPPTFTAGSYVLELSDPSNGSLIYLRSSPFNIAPVAAQPSATPTISGVTTYSTTSGSRSISVTYANLPTSNIQGIFLVYSTNNVNVTSMPTQGGSSSVFLPVPDASPAGTYILRVLATTNNQTIVESAPFSIGPVAVISPPTFSVTPTSGTAPLYVSFSTNQKSGTFYYGNGAFLASCPPDDAANGACNFSLGSGWTYSTPGTYTAELTTACPKSQPQCSTTVLGTATVTVAPPTVPGDSGNGVVLSFQVVGNSNIPLGSGATLQWQRQTNAPAICDLLVANNPNQNYLDAYNSGAYQAQMPNVQGSQFTVTPAVPDTLYMIRCQSASTNIIGVKAVHVTTYASSTPTSSSADKNANLANALTALQSALQALLGKLGH